MDSHSKHKLLDAEVSHVQIGLGVKQVEGPLRAALPLREET